MSCAEALRRCPQAVFVRPRHRVYAEYSKAVWLAVRTVCPTVERTGLDEGYLDIEEIAGEFRRARAVAEAVQAAVRAATRLSGSLGVASCKVVAKVASDRRKPGGLTVVPPGREAAFLAPFAIRLLPVVGRRAEARLVEAGVTTIGALADLGDDELRRLLRGRVGGRLRNRACGIDPRPLELEVESISIYEETFERDVIDRAVLHEELRRMALSVGARLTRGRVGGAHGDHEGALSGLRDPDRSQPAGIDDTERIAELACTLLDRALADRPARSASWASGCRTSRPTGSSSWPERPGRARQGPDVIRPELSLGDLNVPTIWLA